jgi:hypothetical protein
MEGGFRVSMRLDSVAFIVATSEHAAKNAVTLRKQAFISISLIGKTQSQFCETFLAKIYGQNLKSADYKLINICFLVLQLE